MSQPELLVAPPEHAGVAPKGDDSSETHPSSGPGRLLPWTKLVTLGLSCLSRARTELVEVLDEGSEVEGPDEG